MSVVIWVHLLHFIKNFPSSNIYVFEPANDNFKYLKNKFKKILTLKFLKKLLEIKQLKIFIFLVIIHQVIV